MPTEYYNDKAVTTDGALMSTGGPADVPAPQTVDTATDAVSTPAKAPVAILSSKAAIPEIQKQQQTLADMTTQGPQTYYLDTQGNTVDASGNKVTGTIPAGSKFISSTKTSADATNTNGTNATKDAKQTTDAAKSAAEDFVTLINANGQKQTFYNPAGNLASIKGLMSQGYSVSQSSVSDPQVSSALSGTKAPADTTAETNTAQQNVDSAQKAVDSLVGDMNKYMISDDELNQQINNIKQTFQNRIADMQDVNNRRVSALNTTGIRLGSQYSGGAGGNFGGIISEEERQGGMRIADLTSQMNDAVTAAKQAQKSQNWTVFSKQMDIAEKKREETVATLTAYNKALVDADVKSKETLQKTKDQLTKDVTDVMTSARKNNAPTSVVNAIQNVLDKGGSIADAVNAAGDYATDATGIVGEYYAYKRDAKANGQTPLSFDDYQTRDANRKAKIAASANGLSPNVLAKATTIADQFKSEQTIQQYQTIAQGLQAFKSLGDSPADDIQRIYTFAKTMDPNSAVREGEYKTVQDYAQAYLPTLGIKGIRLVDNAGFLTQGARDLMEKSLDKKFAPVEASYKSIRNSYTDRINKITGSSDGADYLTDYTQPPLAKDLVKEESDAQNTVKAYIDANLNKKADIDKNIKAMEATLGRPITSAELLDAFPEYKAPSGSSSGFLNLGISSKV